MSGVLAFFRRLFPSRPKERHYVNDWYYWDDESWMGGYKLDVHRMINSDRFKEMCENISRLHHSKDGS